MALQAEDKIVIGPAPSTDSNKYQEAGKERLQAAPQSDDKNRFKLTNISLWLVLVSILAILLLVYSLKFEASGEIQKVLFTTTDSVSKNSPASDSLLERKIQLIEHIQNEKKDYRDFFLKIAQMILLNLLLPVFTALLGYRAGKSDND